MDWNKDQDWERDWCGNCCNTYTEEGKQLFYAKKMGLNAFRSAGRYPVYDLNKKTIIDVGGGPTSILLKCINFDSGVVADPCRYPDWTLARYKAHGLEFVQVPGENLSMGRYFDEGWCYNVLQHTLSPKDILANMKKHCSVIRIFEWINIPASIGHPQILKAEALDEWLGGVGQTGRIDEDDLHGDYYHGIFKGELYP